MHIQYEYDHYRDDISTLLFKINTGKQQYTHIVGVVRGGCIPAAHLSNILNTPFVPLVWSHSRNEKELDNKVILDKNNKCLIVDDILDEGTTLYEITNHYKSTDTGVLIYNCANRYSIVPTYAAWTINRQTTTQWFDFWWEKT